MKTYASLAAVIVLSTPAPAWADSDAAGFRERVAAVVRSSDPPTTIMVIRLWHAEAEELAHTLRPILPPGVTVVPHSPTNSLIFSGPSGEVERALGAAN